MNSILILKVRYELGHVNETQIEFLKAAILAGFDAQYRHQASFEVLVEDEQETARAMMERVRAEFKEQDGYSR